MKKTVLFGVLAVLVVSSSSVMADEVNGNVLNINKSKPTVLADFSPRTECELKAKSNLNSCLTSASNSTESKLCKYQYNSDISYCAKKYSN